MGRIRKGIKKAVALHYTETIDNAPKVIASGKGMLAEKIIEVARQNNIPIKDDPLLAELLVKVEIEREIPPELYETIAQIFAFIYKLDSQFIKRTSLQ